MWTSVISNRFSRGKLFSQMYSWFPWEFPLSPLQVHGYPGLPGDVRQHPRSDEQAAPAVPPASQGDAGHRVRDMGLDLRVPAPVPQPPLELQHHGQGSQPVWAPAVTQ